MNRLVIASALALAFMDREHMASMGQRKITVYPPKPKDTDADRERMAAAQAKRERKAAKCKRNNVTSKVNQIVAFAVKTHPSVKVISAFGSTVFISRNAEQDWIDNHYELTDAEEAEAQALSDDGGDAMALARRFAGVQS